MSEIKTADAAAETAIEESFEINADAPGAVPESRCYTVEDLQAILMISRSSVYALLKKKEFRWIRVGRSGYRISKKSFDDWMDRTA